MNGAFNVDLSQSALLGDAIQRDHFHYGFGRRFCPGVHVAETSLFISIACILWAFIVERLSDSNLDMDLHRGIY